MTALLDPETPSAVRCSHCGHKPAPVRTHGVWHKVVLLLGILAFILGVLWLFASHFDATEIKAALSIATPFIIKEIWPEIKNALRTVGEASQLSNE